MRVRRLAGLTAAGIAGLVVAPAIGLAPAAAADPCEKSLEYGATAAADLVKLGLLDFRPVGLGLGPVADVTLVSTKSGMNALTPVNSAAAARLLDAKLFGVPLPAGSAHPDGDPGSAAVERGSAHGARVRQEPRPAQDRRRRPVRPRDVEERHGLRQGAGPEHGRHGGDRQRHRAAGPGQGQRPRPHVAAVQRHPDRPGQGRRPGVLGRPGIGRRRRDLALRGVPARPSRSRSSSRRRSRSARPAPRLRGPSTTRRRS